MQQSESKRCRALGKSVTYFANMRKQSPEMYKYLISLHKSQLIAYKMFVNQFNEHHSFLLNKYLENKKIFIYVLKKCEITKDSKQRFIESLLRERKILVWKVFKKRKKVYDFYKENK